MWDQDDLEVSEMTDEEAQAYCADWDADVAAMQAETQSYAAAWDANVAAQQAAAGR